ncbi:hypothetical protein HGA92_02650 [Candidatus Gracilibacteria bacterium]|nr:hypothetical protein [Candidatus Gracilibacteria bacterium]NUJ98317.1 hypothetical protein [Candidatus Gracilibacteria bacterium]NUJ99328.1 hypothetical protein [Candidatus Gracilibacteria bacterium]
MKKEVYDYIAKKVDDRVIEEKICKISGEKFYIFQSEKDFLERISPRFPLNSTPGLKGNPGVKIFPLPFPTLSPQERQRRRMLHKNDRSLYSTTSALSGEKIITIYNPEKHKKIYSSKEWWSDSWEALDYGRDFDFSQSFFEQYGKLLDDVPKIAMVNDNGVASENIEYCQNVAYSKDCYLTTVAWKLEHSHYSSNMASGKWLLDCFFVMDSENCYECFDSYDLNQCFFLQNSQACRDCYFGYDLTGCENCLFCVSLENKKYHIFNKVYSKEDYEKYVKTFQKNLKENREKMEQNFSDFLKQFPKKNMNLYKTERSFGNNLVNAKNSLFCYNLKNSENCKYWTFGDTGKNAQDLTVGGELERCYEGIVPDHSHKACFTIFCWSCYDVRYSEMCHHCESCFGCVGLKRKKYCILNKQYSKEDYEKLVPKIIEHMSSPQPSPEREGEIEWGEFFPASLSPFGYNETIAQDYFPINPNNVIPAKAEIYKNEKIPFNDSETSSEGQRNSFSYIDRKGNTYNSLEEAGKIRVFQWSPKKDINIPVGIKILKQNKNRNDEEILKNVFKCEKSGRLFRLIADELKFYHRFHLPLPLLHPDERTKKRISLMPPKELFLHKNKNGNEFISVFNPEENGNVFENK